MTIFKKQFGLAIKNKLYEIYFDRVKQIYIYTYSLLMNCFLRISLIAKQCLATFFVFFLILKTYNRQPFPIK